jgi:hypothetical protein
VYQTSLSKDDEEKLKKALEHENVSAAAEEMGIQLIELTEDDQALVTDAA